MIEQLRRATTFLINVNPTVVKIYRKQSVDNGMGQLVPFGEPELVQTANVRLSHEAGGVQTNQEKTYGLDTNLSIYLLADWITSVQENDIIETPDGTVYELGPVNVFYSQQQIHQKEAPCHIRRDV
jgi:hypothetical protein